MTVDRAERRRCAMHARTPVLSNKTAESRGSYLFGKVMGFADVKERECDCERKRGI